MHRVRKSYKITNSEDAFSFHYYDKYNTPDARKHDYEELPEGLTKEEHFEYANVDPSNHYFKEDKVLPWLREVL